MWVERKLKVNGDKSFNLDKQEGIKVVETYSIEPSLLGIQHR